jgi:hypothetical protein
MCGGGGTQDTYLGVLNYKTTTNDVSWSSPVVWLPRRQQRRGTWFPYERDQWWGEVTLLTQARHHLFPFAGACRHL